MDDGDIPPFDPHPWLRGGDIQTIAGRYLPGRGVAFRSDRFEVGLGDGDLAVVRESVPPSWKQGDPVALIVHGLGGCGEAPYVIRLAARLLARGVRVLRMNLRGAGDGFGLARGIYHAGRTEDLRTVSDWAMERAAGSPLALVGFSLGGSLVLKLAAEASTVPLAGLDCVMAASAPLDLAACCRQLQCRRNHLYDRNFVRSLKTSVEQLHRKFPELGPVDWRGVESLYEFDDRYTARRNGFSGAEEYYDQSSAGPRLARIAVPGLIVHAEDDPFIPRASVERFSRGSNLALELIPAGGHLGFVSRTTWNGDRRWLESRMAAWLVAHWAHGAPLASSAESMAGRTHE